MKRLIVIMLVVTGFAVPATAHAATSTQTIPLNTFVAACNGDTIQLSGSLLIIQTGTTTASGGFVFSLHFQPQGVSGVDLQTGTMYRGTGVTRSIAVSSPVGGSTQTLVNQFRVQATSGGQSFIITELLHVTVNANGTLTAFLDNFSASC